MGLDDTVRHQHRRGDVAPALVLAAESRLRQRDVGLSDLEVTAQSCVCVPVVSLCEHLRTKLRRIDDSICRCRPVVEMEKPSVPSQWHASAVVQHERTVVRLEVHIAQPAVRVLEHRRGRQQVVHVGTDERAARA